MTIRVLVVDDSMTARKLLSDALAGSAEIEIAGTASNGGAALAKIPELNPDVITLDVEMPGMNGIATLEAVRHSYPRLPVIMFSSFTEAGAAITVQALSAGASDYVTKPSHVDSYASAVAQVRRDLVGKIVALINGSAEAAVGIAGAPGRLRNRKWPGVQPVGVLAIGASTGGPTALSEVLGHLPADFAAPIVVVQHMPTLFTRFLAERLNTESALSVREGEQGKTLKAGDVWIAPGDYHMTIETKGAERFIGLSQNAPENSCRPAVDVLFRSVAGVYGPSALAVVLTGMGADGARGAACIRQAGGEVLVQDKHSSVVWGMPGAVVKSGAANGIYPLRDIATEIMRRVKAGRAQAAAAR